MPPKPARFVESAQLAGLKIWTKDGLVVFVEPKDEGEAGVREPVRPKPSAPTVANA